MRRADGEATFDADGQTWTLRFDYNALADLEDALRKTSPDVAIEQVLDRAAKGLMTIRETRLLFWAMLQDGHPGTDERQAGRLVIPGMAAMKAAMEAGADNGGDVTPPGKPVAPKRPGRTPTRPARH